MCEYCGLSHIPSFPLLAVYKESAYCEEPRNCTVGKVAFETVQKLYKIILKENYTVKLPFFGPLSNGCLLLQYPVEVTWGSNYCNLNNIIIQAAIEAHSK